MKRNVFLLMMLAVVLAFSMAVIGCDDGSDNGGSGGNGGSGNGGGGGNSGIVPSDLQGTWKQTVSNTDYTRTNTYTLTANSLVRLEEDVTHTAGMNSYEVGGTDIPYTVGETYSRKTTYSITSCATANNNTTATKGDYPSGIGVSIKVTKCELSSNYNPGWSVAIGNEGSISFYINTAKNKVCLNGSPNSIYDKQ